MSKDPITAHGISDAFRDASLLAEAIEQGTCGQGALAGYEAARNARAFPNYEATLQAITFGPLPQQVLRLRAAVKNDPDVISAYFGMQRGGITPEEFFAREDINRIMPAIASTAG